MSMKIEGNDFLVGHLRDIAEYAPEVSVKDDAVWLKGYGFVTHKSPKWTISPAGEAIVNRALQKYIRERGWHCEVAFDGEDARIELTGGSYANTQVVSAPGLDITHGLVVAFYDALIHTEDD